MRVTSEAVVKLALGLAAAMPGPTLQGGGNTMRRWHMENISGLSFPSTTAHSSCRRLCLDCVTIRPRPLVD